MIFSVNILGLTLWKVKMRSNYKAFQKVLKDCNQTPNKMLVDKASEFYNMSSMICTTATRCFKTHNEGKPVVPGPFIKVYDCHIKKSMCQLTLKISKIIQLYYS